MVGAGHYNGDQQDDLLVRQYSAGMLGYYSNGDTTNWNVLGYGVGMEWTVIAQGDGGADDSLQPTTGKPHKASLT